MKTGKLLSMILFSVLLPISPADCADGSEPAPGAVKHVDPKEAEKLIADKKVIILDIRTPNEFKTAHIAGATNIDFLAQDFEKRISLLDTNKAYLVHCASGGRSTRSLPVLKKHQFEFLYHLDGGIKAWEKAGLPVDKPQ
jgi:rhodanese-related sulfurtransferase